VPVEAKRKPPVVDVPLMAGRAVLVGDADATEVTSRFAAMSMVTIATKPLIL